MGLLLFMAAGDVAPPAGLLGGGVDLGDDSGLLEVVRLLVTIVVEVGVRGADEATTRLRGPGEVSSLGGRPAEAAAAAAPSFKSAAKLFPISEGEACLFR